MTYKTFIGTLLVAGLLAVMSTLISALFFRLFGFELYTPSVIAWFAFIWVLILAAKRESPDAA